MRALQISKLYDLVLNESRISIRNREMSHTFLHRNSRGQFWRSFAGRIHDAARFQLAPIAEDNRPGSDLINSSVDELRAGINRLLNEECSHGGRIHNQV